MKQFAHRMQIGVLLLVALLFVPFRGRKKNIPETILVIQLAKLGDMICTTPMFRAVKEHYPESRLFVLGNAINREVLAGNPHVDEYLTYTGSFTDTVRTLRACRIDAVCITVPSFDMLASAIVARVPHIVVPEIKSGWSPYVTLPYRILSKFVIRKDHHMGSYAPREYLRLLEPLGIHVNDTKKEVRYTTTAFASVETICKKHSIRNEDTIIGILPGAGNDIKSWPPEYFAKLISLIATHHHSVTFVLLGAHKDAERARIILRHVSSSAKVVNLINLFSLDELKACISKLHMVIGADTGPQYIAEALGIPTIDIVGPVDEREQPPTGNLHRIVKADRKKPELYVMNARVYNYEEARRQVESITPDMVFQAFESLSAEIGVFEEKS